MYSAKEKKLCLSVSVINITGSIPLQDHKVYVLYRKYNFIKKKIENKSKIKEKEQYPTTYIEKHSIFRIQM